MKGIYIKNGSEFYLEAFGEQWLQGEKLKGVMGVKNHSANALTIPTLEVNLALGEFKKVHAKNHQTWEEVSSIKMAGPHTIQGKESLQFPFEFTLDKNAAITDKGSGLFLLYGEEGAWKKEELYGHLQLIVDQHPYLNYFIETFERFIRFKVKQKKFSSKGRVEYKMAPPDAKEWKNIESMTLAFNFEKKAKESNKDNIELHYLFTTKSLDLADGQLAVQKKKKEFSQTLTPSQYQLYGSANHQGIQDAFKEISTQVTSTLFKK
ncbi:MAG: sporulation protein [Oligoflexia bacterium]|nr:sporulation protein [Oligoflexia bacterium]MBF0364975.1 sporulation protein [Oligoflexia bacterium]